MGQHADQIKRIEAELNDNAENMKPPCSPAKYKKLAERNRELRQSLDALYRI